MSLPISPGFDKKKHGTKFFRFFRVLLKIAFNLLTVQVDQGKMIQLILSLQNSCSDKHQLISLTLIFLNVYSCHSSVFLEFTCIEMQFLCWLQYQSVLSAVMLSLSTVLI